jgi:hypothetical protein
MDALVDNAGYGVEGSCSPKQVSVPYDENT